MNNKEALKFLKDALSEKKYHLKDLEEEATFTRQDIDVLNYMIETIKKALAKDSKPKPTAKKIVEKT